MNQPAAISHVFPPYGRLRSEKLEEEIAIEPRPLISEDLVRQVEETARAQNRQPEEVVSDAARKYLSEQSWVKALGYGRQRAEALGITTEEDIDKAIADWRRENHPQNGR